MSRPLSWLTCAILTIPGFCLAAEEIAIVPQPDTTTPNAFYVGNRAPLAPSPLIKLPIGAIQPRGWLLRQLRDEADGFIGHLTEISGFLKKDRNSWLSPTGDGDHGWEEVPYWLKGFGDLGYVLRDERIIKEARIWIEGALASQRGDGYFGPAMNLTSLDGKPDLWPHMIMLNALQSYHEFTGDERVLTLMARYFRWQLAYPEADFLLPFWQQQRAADNLASVYWLYNRTGEAWLLDLAHKIHRRTANWTDGIANWHGVNIGQAFRGPGNYYVQAREQRFLDAAERNWQEIRRLYGQVPGGLFGADENCRPGYTSPRQMAETCTMVEMMLSHEMLLLITGDVKWADRCEDIAFNSLPASMTVDQKGLRYLTAPNMIQADRQNKAPHIQNGGEMVSYNPHSYRCCQHNVSHGWPYYAEHLWAATPGNGLAAVLYADSVVKARVGDGTEVTIDQATRYPFDETVRFTIRTPQAVAFPLHLRVPGWCAAPTVAINGQPAKRADRPQGYLVLSRTWQDGDTVTLTLPMTVTITRWEDTANGLSVNRGPLTYSLKIGERYERYGGTDQWPALELYPTTPWNYGLALDDADPAASFKVVPASWPADDQPFAPDAAPITLKARGRRIPQWQPDYLNLVGLLQDSPARTTEPEEELTLIPMGAARLRITCFPTVTAGPDGHVWTEPAQPTPATASHSNQADTIAALSDGVEPRRSRDQRVPRFTWWDRKGSLEWVQYDFPAPRKLSRASVYWFSDQPDGGCHAPASWRLLYRVGDDWRPVDTAGPYGTDLDRYNTVEFAPVETAGLRLEAQLQPDLSAGILEWKVE